MSKCEPATLEDQFEESGAGHAFRCLLLEIPGDIQKDVKERTIKFLKEQIITAKIEVLDWLGTEENFDIQTLNNRADELEQQLKKQLLNE